MATGNEAQPVGSGRAAPEPEGPGEPATMTTKAQT
jgi:hypothetical protein